MTQNSITKSPRLYTELPLHSGQVTVLSAEQAHYLKNVLRKNTGDPLRLFNGRDGEWLCALDSLGKKGADVTPQDCLTPQPAKARSIHAFFAPIKKHRMDFMIEKAVELGVTDLHPILTHNTEVRKINEERMTAQIIEAAEQCERLDIPKLHPLQDIHKAVQAHGKAIYAALERGEHPLAREQLAKDDAQDIAILIGPEGGFTQDEIRILLSSDSIRPVSLGDTILRAETALIKLLSLL